MPKGIKVVLEWDEEGQGFTASVPALEGCFSEGETVEEALANVKEAVNGYLEALDKWKSLQKYGITRAKQLGIAEEDVEAVISLYRKEKKQSIKFLVNLS